MDTWFGRGECREHVTYSGASVVGGDVLTYVEVLVPDPVTDDMLVGEMGQHLIESVWTVQMVDEVVEHIGDA